MDVPGLALLLGAIQTLTVGAFLHRAVLLYLGPETIMPITSVLAAAVGMVLLFWRQVTATVRTGFRRLFVQKRGYSDSNSNLDSRD